MKFTPRTLQSENVEYGMDTKRKRGATSVRQVGLLNYNPF